MGRPDLEYRLLIKGLHKAVCKLALGDGEKGYFGSVLKGALEGYFYSSDVKSLDDLMNALNAFNGDASKENLGEVGFDGASYFRVKLGFRE